MTNSRIIFCAYDNPGNISGPNVWLKRLLPRLKGVGLNPEAWFFTLDSKDSPTAKFLSHSGIMTRRFSFNARTLSKVRWLLELARESPPAVFVPNHVIPAYMASRWFRQSGIPTVGVIHSDDRFYDAVVRMFAGESADWRVTNLVCVSRYLENSVATRASSSVGIDRIPCGVPLPEEKASPPHDELRLVYVGRIQEEQKRISDVAHAFCRAVKEVPLTTAQIIGDGPSFERVVRLIRREGCEGKVNLCGNLDSDQIERELLRSHALVLLSDYEGLPISLMEGMACGLVPICLNIESGIPELINDGENGLLVVDREDDFVAAVRKLRESPQLWSALSNKARQEIEAAYSIDRTVEQWNNLIAALANPEEATPSFQYSGRIDLPRFQSEFCREDFRLHPLISRIANRLRRSHKLGQYSAFQATDRIQEP